MYYYSSTCNYSKAAAHLPKNLPKNMDDATIPANFPSGKQNTSAYVTTVNKSFPGRYESPTMQHDSPSGR